MDVLTLLAWMEFDQMKAESQHEKEQSMLLMDHISRKLAAQLTTMNDKNQKEVLEGLKEFEKALEPEKKAGAKKTTKQVAKSLEWPSQEKFEQLKRLQEQGGAY